MYEDVELLEEFDDLELGDPEEWDYEADDYEEWEMDDLEADYFLGGPFRSLARRAARMAGHAIGGRSGANIASLIARTVLREEDFEEDEFETEDEFASEGGDLEILEDMHLLAEMAAETESEDEADEFIGMIAKLAGPLISSLMGEEYGDFEDDLEYIEDMEDLEDIEDWEDLEDYEAFEDFEEDEFLPALLPLATTILPQVASAAAPLISKGIRAIGRFFRRGRRRRRRAHRETLRALPEIAAEAGVTLKKMVRRDPRVTRKKAAAAVAKATAKKLANPRKVARAVAKNKRAARRARTKRRVLPPRRRVLPARTARRLRV